MWFGTRWRQPSDQASRLVADTSRQSYIHMIACRIRRRQNCRIGPSLFRRGRTVEILKRTDVIVEKHICDYRSIYPQSVEVKLIRTIGIYQCAWRNKLFEDRLTLHWGTLRLFIIQLLTMIEFEFGHWIHRMHLVELIPRLRDSVFIYVIVGEWYRSHICGRLPGLRYFVYQKESSIGWEASLTTATIYTRPNRLLYCVSMLPKIVSLYSTIVCCLTYLKLTTKSAIF